MMTHLGLIGGIGIAATEFYYRGLMEAHASAGVVLDLTITHADAVQLVNNLMTGARENQAELFEVHVRRLQAAGAKCAAVTSIGGHFCISELIERSPLPIVNAITALSDDLKRRKLRRIGLLGTRPALESRLYGGLAEFEVVVPRGELLDQTHAAYVAMALSGRATEEQREAFFAMGRDLCQAQGAEAVVLAGTDLFLAFDGHQCGFPIIDCARVHVDALMRAACPLSTT